MEDPSSAGLVVRAILSFLAVLALLLLAARLLRRVSGGTGARPGGLRALTVVDRQGVGRNAAVVVVEVAGIPLVLGVTETQVNLLSQIEAEQLRAHLEQPGETGDGDRPPNQLLGALQTLRDLTVRRG